MMEAPLRSSLLNSADGSHSESPARTVRGWFLDESFPGFGINSLLFQWSTPLIQRLNDENRASTEMILGFASRYACLGDLDKWAASRLQVACK